MLSFENDCARNHPIFKSMTLQADIVSSGARPDENPIDFGDLSQPKARSDACLSLALEFRAPSDDGIGQLSEFSCSTAIMCIVSNVKLILLVHGLTVTGQTPHQDAQTALGLMPDALLALSLQDAWLSSSIKPISAAAAFSLEE